MYRLKLSKCIDVQANQIGQCAKVRRHRSIHCALVHQPREFEE
jgi:hypothetical protein